MAALRRLAHRLQSFQLPPRLLPLPIPDFRGHLPRFSTSPPHFMTEYLVSYGLSPAAAAKAAPRFSHLSSTAKPDAVVAFLRSQGLGRAQLREIISWVPLLLLSDVDATLSPKFDAVRALGLTRAESARLFALYPSALTYGIRSTLLPRVLFWLDLLGSSRLLMKWLARTWLLKYSVGLLLQNMSTLRGLGVPQDRVSAVVRTQPTVIMQSPAKFNALVARVEACAGILPSSGMYVWCLFSLHNISDRSFRAKRAVVMRAAGCDEEEFAAMFRRAPCFMLVSAGLLRRKVEFLREKVGCSAERLLMNPVLLTLSIDKRMAPRCRAVEALRSKGIDIGNSNMVTIVRLTEDRFVKKYILKYAEKVPEILELYPRVQGHAEIHRAGT